MSELYVLPHDEEFERLLNKAFCDPKRIALVRDIMPRCGVFSAPLLVKLDHCLLHLAQIENMEDRADPGAPDHVEFCDELREAKLFALESLDYYLVRIERIYRKAYQEHDWVPEIRRP